MSEANSNQKLFSLWRAVNATLPTCGQQCEWCKWKIFRCILRCVPAWSPSRAYSSPRLSRGSWLWFIGISNLLYDLLHLVDILRQSAASRTMSVMNVAIFKKNASIIEDIANCQYWLSRAMAFWQVQWVPVLVSNKLYPIIFFCHSAKFSGVKSVLPASRSSSAITP